MTARAGADIGRIKGLLFDKDGTLLDYYKTWVPINWEVAGYAAGGDTALQRRLLRAGGHDPETDLVAAGSVFAGGPIEGIVGMLTHELGGRAPADLRAVAERLFREGGARTSVLIDGACDVAITLRARGYRMGIATNDTAAGLEASLAKHDILPSFEFTCGCDSGFGGKPGPGMVLGFCQAVGLNPSEVAVIGDSTHDLEMGRSAGAGLNIAVLSGPAGRAHLADHADLVLDSIADLPAILTGTFTN